MPTLLTAQAYKQAIIHNIMVVNIAVVNNVVFWSHFSHCTAEDIYSLRIWITTYNPVLIVWTSMSIHQHLLSLSYLNGYSDGTNLILIKKIIGQYLLIPPIYQCVV